jgi:hypothetical protein
MKVNAALGLKVMVLAALLGFVTANVRADDKANATGTWKWTRKTPDGQEQEISATLKQDGEKLAGSVASAAGEVEIQDGKVKDGQVSFQISFDAGGGQITVKFSGKLEGDKIKGKAVITGGDNPGTRDWNPKRVKEEKK